MGSLQGDMAGGITPAPLPREDLTQMSIHIEGNLDISQLPQECIDQCSHSGSCDDDVAHWRDKLDFTVHRANAISYIKSSGAHALEELNEWDDCELAEWILWEACNTFREQQTWEADNPGEPPENSSYGSSCIDISCY